MEDFLKRLEERTRKMKIGDPFAEDTTVGATISKEQGEKVLRYIELAKSEVSRKGRPHPGKTLHVLSK